MQRDDIKTIEEPLVNTTAAWRFRPHTKEERATDDFAGEFFQSNLNTELSESLVREAIQNSLDAALSGSGQQVRVRFVFRKVNFESIEPFVGGLWPRLNSSDLETLEPPAPGGNVDVLSIEDFGTVGLDGDPTRHDDPKSSSKDRYWEFWRNLGRGNKGTSTRGRWGLGKSVFHIASEIGTYFGSTVRNSDGRKLLMGLSQLKVHHLEDERFDSYGYYGLQDDDEFTHPLETSESIGALSSATGLSRIDESGLSLVIPYVRAGITKSSLVEAVVRGYFYPLLTEELVVEIDDSGDVTNINKPYIDSIQDVVGLPDSVIDLARFAISNPTSVKGLSADPPRTSAPHWVDLSFDDDIVDTLQQTLLDTGIAEINVKVMVHPKSTPSSLSEFRLILRNEPDQGQRSVMFIRNGITITSVNHSPLRGYSALVIVQDGALSEFLGDSETPAHTTWKNNSAKYGQKYKYWNLTIGYVANAASQIVGKLSDKPQELDTSLFSDLFFIDRSDTPTSTGRKPRKKKKTAVDVVDPPPVLPPPNAKKFETTELGEGFEISGTDQCPDEEFSISVKMAYAGKSRKSSTRSWHKFDFDLKDSSISIQTKDAKVTARDGNTLVVKVLGKDFSISVEGFDPKRDLFVAPPRIIQEVD